MMIPQKKIRCLIIDDEPPAREIIRRYIDLVPMLSIIDECANAVQAFSVLQNKAIDILFLDIQMPQVSGIDLIKTLKFPPKIILTTAFEQYALKAFELDVIDYLLKPIQFDRFLKAINKALPSTQVQDSLNRETENLHPNKPFLYFRADRKMVKVMLSDILYIESLKDYVKIYTVKGVVITKYSIAALETMLPETAFMRTHRSFIVAVDKVTSFTPEILELEKFQIPIGKLYRQQLLKKLDLSAL